MATTDQTQSNTTGEQTGLGGLQPHIEKAKAFAKARPWAVGTLAAVLGLATLNTLRGKS